MYGEEILLLEVYYSNFSMFYPLPLRTAIKTSVPSRPRSMPNLRRDTIGVEPLDLPQHRTRYNRTNPKRNTRVPHIAQRIRIRPSAPHSRSLEHRGRDALHARDLRRVSEVDGRELRRGGQRQAGFDGVGDDIDGELLDELVVEDIVVDGVADAAADDADGQRQRDGRGDQLVRRDGDGDRGGRDEHAADAERRDGAEADERARRVGRDARQGAAEGGHDHRRHEEELAVVAGEPGQRGVNDGCADCRAQSRSETLETDLDGVRREDGAELEGEEVEEGVEVHARDEGDDVCCCDDALAGEEFGGNHGIFGDLPFPVDEGGD